jgi:DNA-directed RNA polymerase specialized sigma24 family protein
MKVERVGLGYVLSAPNVGLSLSIDRLTESRGELSGELHVAATGPGQLLRGRFNLSSISTRGTVAKHLRSRLEGVDWADILESFCGQVLEAERRGAPVVVVGNRPPRAAPTWVLDPLLIRHEPTILYGEGGTGKSTLAAAVAASVASGVSAFEGWEVPAAQPVLVLDWEADADAWNDLIASLCLTLGVAPPDVFYRPCSGSMPGQIHQIAREVTEREVGLIIVDSVGLATPMARDGGDAAEGALRMFDALRLIGVSSLLIDHVSKAQMVQERAVGPYGSVYKVNSARSVYELRAGTEPEEDAGERHLALIHRKHNLTPRQPTVGIRVERTPESLLLRREEVRAEPGLVTGLTVAERLKQYLRSERPMTVPDIAKGIGVDAAQIKNTLHRRRDQFAQVGYDGRLPTWHLLSDRDDGGRQ